MQLTNRLVESLSPKEKPFEVRDDTIKGFLLRVQPTGTKVYYLAYVNGEGKKQRSRIGAHGTITATQARDAAARQAGKVALDIDVHHEKKEAKLQAEIDKSKTLKTFLENRYEPWVTSERKSGKETVKTIKAQFDSFMNTPLDEISIWNIEKWRTARRKSKTKPATINRNMTALKALLAKAVEWNIIEANPLAKLKPLEVDNHGKVRYLSTQEEASLRQALNIRDERIRETRRSHNVWLKERGHDAMPEIPANKFADHLQPMVLLSLNTGLRRGELFALQWDNISFSKGTLTVAGSTAKNGKTRHVPLNQEAMAALKQWRPALNATGLVFPSKANESQFNNVRKAFLGVLAAAKIKAFRWHDIRHHFASKLVMASVDINTVRELLGHANLDMTLRYAHLAPEHKKDAVERLVVHG